MITSTESIYSILSFPTENIGLFSFQKNFITTDTQRLINKVVKELDSFSQGSPGSIKQDSSHICAAYASLQSLKDLNITTLSETFSTRRLKRTLAFTIAFAPPKNPHKAIVFSNSFPIVVAFLKSNWHTGMLLGLFNCLILYWRSIPVKHSILLREQLKEIISEYSGKRNDLLTIQRNISFYSEQYGPSTCAGTMAGNREFPSKLFDNYGLPKLYKHSEFCSCFISEYTKTACRNADFEIFIDEIALFLADFQDKSTCQLCFAYLAIRADNNTSEVFKQRILTHAVRIAGDPAKASKWLPSPLFSEQEKKSFEDGALILNRWISLKFIDLFFEKVSMDKDRKKFWQKYYKSIDKIKILGDEQLKLKFMRDERVRDYIDSRFGMLSYGCSVLLMQAKEHVFVEFGGTGNAFYAYKRNARKCPKFDAGNYSIYDLKDTTMSYLNNSLSQGRLVHRNGWQLELSQWLALHAGIRND